MKGFCTICTRGAKSPVTDGSNELIRSVWQAILAKKGEIAKSGDSFTKTPRQGFRSGLGGFRFRYLPGSVKQGSPATGKVV